MMLVEQASCTSSLPIMVLYRNEREGSKVTFLLQALQLIRTQSILQAELWPPSVKTVYSNVSTAAGCAALHLHSGGSVLQSSLLCPTKTLLFRFFTEISISQTPGNEILPLFFIPQSSLSSGVYP